MTTLKQSSRTTERRAIVSTAVAVFMAIHFLLAPAAGLLAQQAGTSPVKVFLLAGQSNMQGHGEISPATTMGTLGYIVENDPNGGYQFLVDGGGGWAVREDVWIHYERSASDLLTGRLTSGYGAANSTIGPELGFGHVVGNAFNNQVLIVKAAWGGKSLAVDFRPPSSGGTVGFYYNEILRLVNDAVTNLNTYFPDYDGQGYELVGLGWHQGWNDRVNQTYNDEYEFNMANFIRDIRIDLNEANLPFVIATTGMSGWEETHPRALSLMEAQLAVAQYPEFQGNVFTVETRPFYRPADQSPANQAYHWNRNAETLLLIGDAMGRAMLELIDAASVPPSIMVNDDSFGFRNGRFGFNITGVPDQSVAVEVSTNLLPGSWTPISIHTLSGEATYFSHPEPNSLPEQFYRVRKIETLRIASQPQSQQVDPGTAVTFAVVARGDDPLHYQWQFNEVPIPDATNANYTIEDVQPRHRGSYDVVVSNDFATTNSEAALLTVLVPPAIVAHPQDQTVRVGQTATFTVAVTNDAVLPVGYRWRKGFATVDNQVLDAHTSTLTITNVQLSDAGNYTVVVTNAAFYLPGYLSSQGLLTVLEE